MQQGQCEKIDMRGKKAIRIIGAGITGITLAQSLAECFQVIIYEKGPRIGGYCADAIDDNGIIHPLHGPHILHVDDPHILKYARRFSPFNSYRHHVKAQAAGRIYDFPINLATINAFFGKSLNPSAAREFMAGKISKVFTANPANLEQAILNFTGRELYEAFFENYSAKQWGRHPRELPPEIIGRIPLRYNYNSTYYKKAFHAMPKRGYQAMFRQMLDSPNIRVNLSVEADSEILSGADPVLCTASIDSFFQYRHGRLNYIGADFKMEYVPCRDYQGCSVINYPDAGVPWTRICEPRHFYPERESLMPQDKSLIIRETPSSDAAEKSYPLRDSESMSRLAAYLRGKKKYANLYFAGRLGEYKYYDMENSIRAALELADKIKKKYG